MPKINIPESLYQRLKNQSQLEQKTIPRLISKMIGDRERKHPNFRHVIGLFPDLLDPDFDDDFDPDFDPDFGPEKDHVLADICDRLIMLCENFSRNEKDPYKDHVLDQIKRDFEKINK